MTDKTETIEQRFQKFVDRFNCGGIVHDEEMSEFCTLLGSLTARFERFLENREAGGNIPVDDYEQFHGAFKVQQSEPDRVMSKAKGWVQIAANTACKMIMTANGSMCAETRPMLASNIQEMRKTLLTAFDMLSSAAAELEHAKEQSGG